jgi:phosphoribosyl 1,2-cyclic phosphodiesterase
MKRVRFWGTRGSLPVALTAEDVRRKVVAALVVASGRTFASAEEAAAFVARLPFDVRGTYGGHSPCVELDTGRGEYVLCDLGSGVRAFGQAALARHGDAPQTYHVFVSHVHWDHIMGLPFFQPAYIPGNRIIVYGGHRDLEAALRRQMDQPSFPVPFSTFRASIEFVTLAPDATHEVAGMAVSVKRQRHPGDSYGYRFEAQGRCVVYSTDSEHRFGDPLETQAFAHFFRAADVVIFDAMYSLADAISVKADWGHSSNIAGVDLCQLAQAATLCLFHHEPAVDDAAIEAALAETRRYEAITRTEHVLEVIAAYDGLELIL